MVELRYYRRLGHAQHDPQDYVDPEELREWAERDPIDRFRRLLVDEGHATEEELEERRRRIHDEIQDAAAQAVADSPPEPSDALRNVYADVEVPAPWTRSDRGVPLDPWEHVPTTRLMAGEGKG